MKILIVEDDPNLRGGLVDLLSLEGYETVTAEDGAMALQVFSDSSPDFCILDVGLPDQDGFEVCKSIRELDANIPILFLTARTEEIDRLRGFGMGADDYVGKPFSSSELIARIRAIVRRQATPPAPRLAATPTFEMRDLRIDPKALRAFRGDQTIDLTQRELDLLQLLSERAGQAIGRDEIYDRCWGHDYFPSSRALDQFVATLRRKIEREPCAPEIIATVYRVGYRFDP